MSVNFTAEADALLELCIEIQQIPAPTGEEMQRALWVADYLQRAGFAPVEMDAYGNVYACVRGHQPGPALLVTAHTDTVFPASADLTITREPGGARIFGPGLGDNSTGVAALLWLGRQLQQRRPVVDVWLVANTGEEGNGDLRGMRAAVDRLAGQIGACIVIEGMGLSRVVHRALGSRRFRIEVTAPGGHSWSDFGAASAVHVLVQLAADLTRLKASAQPRTTFNIGVVEGGTSINTIAQQASLELDLRSEDPAALNAIVAQANGHCGTLYNAPLAAGGCGGAHGAHRRPPCRGNRRRPPAGAGCVQLAGRGGHSAAAQQPHQQHRRQHPAEPGHTGSLHRRDGRRQRPPAGRMDSAGTAAAGAAPSVGADGLGDGVAGAAMRREGDEVSG
jgi:hypothetical protein